MAVQGVLAFDGVALLEIERVDFSTGNSVALVGHAAFVSTKTGHTYGKTWCRQWSPRTYELLAELRASMEQDVGTMVFAKGDAPTGAISQLTAPTGIGEHAGAAPDADPL